VREKERHEYNCRNEFAATMIYARNNGAAGTGAWRKCPQARHLTRGLNVWLTILVEDNGKKSKQKRRKTIEKRSEI